VSLKVLLREWRKKLGLEDKEWRCHHCRYGASAFEDVCGYMSPAVPFPRICIYVQHRVQRLLAQLMGPPEDED